MKPAQVRTGYQSLITFLPTGNLPQLNDVFDEPPNAVQFRNLPPVVETPKDAELWLNHMANSWERVPAFKDAYVQAGNRLRVEYADWFQANGYGGH